jgi:hypothetical protein
MPNQGAAGWKHDAKKTFSFVSVHPESDNVPHFLAEIEIRVKTYTLPK